MGFSTFISAYARKLRHLYGQICFVRSCKGTKKYKSVASGERKTYGRLMACIRVIILPLSYFQKKRLFREMECVAGTLSGC